MSAARRVLYHHRIRAEDGQAVHVREMIGALRAAGHEVDECALVPKARATAVDSGRSSGGVWRRLRLPRRAVEVAEMLYNHKGCRMLVERGRRAPPDFVYERHALHLRAGLDAARELGVPLLLEVNSPMSVEVERLGQLRFARRARRTERLVLGGADAVLAVTDVLKDMLVDLGADRARVHVVGNGAAPSRYDDAARADAQRLRASWGLQDDTFVLGFVGYMRAWHRLELVLDVMTRRGFQGLQLALVGEGPALEPLLAEAERRGLSDRIRACGAVPASAVPAHVLAFDGALIPAINDYASPLKLFDSLCAGVVTLAPDQPNLRELVRDGSDGLLFEPGSADALARQLGRVVEDRALATRLGEAGCRRLQDEGWTWDGSAARVLEVYESLQRRGR